MVRGRPAAVGVGRPVSTARDAAAAASGSGRAVPGSSTVVFRSLVSFMGALALVDPSPPIRRARQAELRPDDRRQEPFSADCMVHGSPSIPFPSLRQSLKYVARQPRPRSTNACARAAVVPWAALADRPRPPVLGRRQDLVPVHARGLEFLGPRVMPQ